MSREMYLLQENTIPPPHSQMWFTHFSERSHWSQAFTIFYIHVWSFIHPKHCMLIIKICKIQTLELYFVETDITSNIINSEQSIYTTEVSNSRQQLWDWLVESQKWLPTVNESTTHLNCARHVAGWLILWYGPSTILSCEKVTVHTLMAIKNRHIDKKKTCKPHLHLAILKKKKHYNIRRGWKISEIPMTNGTKRPLQCSIYSLNCLSVCSFRICTYLSCSCCSCSCCCCFCCCCCWIPSPFSWA